jgi:hypothetical protein
MRRNHLRGRYGVSTQCSPVLATTSACFYAGSRSLVFGQFRSTNGGDLGRAAGLTRQAGLVRVEASDCWHVSPTPDPGRTQMP